MASPFQQRALRRKVIYAALILVLLTAALAWRKANFQVFGLDVRGVDAQAAELAIREQSRGEVDLIGAVVRLSTIGSRGAATCVLWMDAMDAQKRNQWNELEVYVRSLTKLQPHFVTPWIFQSWNLAYNVSVESDRPNDKYFYIARGINLLAEGDRQNRDNPDMRWSIGFFLQHKIGQSDDTNVLRSLSQLSMIPPNERDPGRFWTTREGQQEINLAELEDFCKKHPQLVRRLRESIHHERKQDVTRQFRCETPQEMVRFLAENFRVPSKWQDRLPSLPGMWKEEPDKLLPAADRFPVLPPPHTARREQQAADDRVLTTDSDLLDEHDAYQVARSWYSFAQEPLPAPDELPGHSKPIVDRVHQRLPKHMTTLIFRDYPAQAQRFTAERLQDEGWYDAQGWEVSNPRHPWFREQNDRFRDGSPAIIGGGRDWGVKAWQKTLDLWKEFGEANHLRFTIPAERDAMEQRARAFGYKYNLSEGSTTPQLRTENLDPETQREYFAWQFMKWFTHYRHISNFPHHYNRAVVEGTEEAVRARKTFFEAENELLRGHDTGALKIYQRPDSFRAWRNVLLANKEFREDSFIQEQAFELQLRYLDLYRRLGGNAFKAQSCGMVLLPTQSPAGGGVCPINYLTWLAPRAFKSANSKRKPSKLELDRDNPLLGGPFDGVDDEGHPLIPQYSRDIVLRRRYPAAYAPKGPAGMPPAQTSSRPSQP